jgi:hypothetical protein
MDGRRRARNPRFLRLSSLFGWLLILSSDPVAGQQTQASIIGQARDEAGSVVPGVTVTATSPSLQVSSVTAVTNEVGEYRLTPLPIGTYAVVYTLQGFQTLRHENVQLAAGFVARLDVVMKVGGLEESIIVTGVSPVVDVTTTATATHFTAATLDMLPTSRNSLVGLLAQAPGVRTNLDVGGGTVGGRPWNRLFGQPGEPWYRIEGVVTSSLTLDGGAANYWDYNTIDEATMQTVGSDAEAATRGVQLNAIVKSGGNTFHGGTVVHLTHGKLQSDNIDDDLKAQGITSGNPLKGRNDYFGDLGGRIIMNKLWFYAAARRRTQQAQVLGAQPKPDGSTAYGSQTETFHTEKLSYQLSSGNKIVGFYQWNLKETETPGPSYVAYETRGVFEAPTRQAKIDWQAVRGNSLVLSVLQGYWSQHSHNPRQTDNVPTRDIFTLQQTGDRTPPSGERSENRRWQTSANLSWYRPDSFHGNHEIKAGFDYTANSYARPQSVEDRGKGAKPGRLYNYSLLFNNGVPYQIQAYNTPNYPWSASNYIGLFVKDSWTIARRLTLNLGLRYAHDDGFVPGGCFDAAEPPGNIAFPAVCREKGQLAIYSKVVPRLHASYDLLGDGKTVLKAGWARFGRMRHLDPDVVKIDPNRPNWAFYRWNDRNGNRLYDAGEVDLNPNGADYVSRGEELNAIPNPDEEQPVSDELSADLERALTDTISVRVTGVYSHGTSLRLQNNRRPYESYNIPVTRPDRGPDAVAGTADDPGTSFTYYEFSPALAGLNFEQFMYINDPNADRTYKSFEIASFKRLQNGWQFAMSYSATKKDIPFLNGASGGFLPEVEAAPFNPNAEINQADRTWEWQSKISGAYVWPADVMLSANFEHRSGIAWARQVLFTGGATIPSIVLNVEPIGTRRMPNVNLLDLRVQKTFRLGRERRAMARINLYNVLNHNSVTALTMRSGPNFLRPTEILSPRILEFGLSYTF